MVLPLFLLGALFCGSVVSEYHYACRDSELALSNSSEPARFNHIAIGETTLAADAAPGTVHNVSIGHHFCQSDWYLTARNGASWERLPGRKANMSRAVISPSSPTTREIQKRGILSDIAIFGFGQVVKSALQLFCCSSSEETGVIMVNELTTFDTASGFEFTLENQNPPALIELFNESLEEVTAVIVDEGILEVFADIAFNALEIFLD